MAASFLDLALTAIQDQDERVVRSAIEGLATAGKECEPCAQALSALLRDRRVEVRGEAAKAIGQNGVVACLAALALALADPDEPVRRAAFAALTDLKWTPSNAVDQARFALLQDYPDHHLPDLGPAIQRGEFRFHPELEAEVIAGIRHASRNDSTSVRDSAFGALGTIGDLASLDYLANYFAANEWPKDTRSAIGSASITTPF